MTTKAILAELNTLGIDKIKTGSMQIQMALPGSIVLCLAVASIINEYNSTPEKEKRVSTLLSMLCKRHFKVISD